jgi:hypothetical protein
MFLSFTLVAGDRTGKRSTLWTDAGMVESEVDGLSGRRDIPRSESLSARKGKVARKLGSASNIYKRIV